MFNIDTAQDKLKLLHTDYTRLLSDPLNISLAEKCCLDAWHISDWDFEEQRKTNTILTLVFYRKSLFQELPEMRVLHDLSNTMKHKNLTRPKAKINRTDVVRGEFSSEFSKEHNVSRLEVSYGEGNRIDIDELIKIAIDYWTKNMNTRKS
jgi:hypothetical protein